MKRLVFASLIAGAVVIAPLAAEFRTVGAADPNDVKLIGCLVGGEDDDDGYLLTNAMGDVTPPAVASGTVAPGPVGTTGATAPIFYWLEDEDALKPHLGHRVEVEGELKGDLKSGEIEIEREDKWTELTIKSDGRELTARVPQSLFIVSGRSSDDRSLDVLVRKVDVQNVRMLAAHCD